MDQQLGTNHYLSSCPVVCANTHTHAHKQILECRALHRDDSLIPQAVAPSICELEKWLRLRTVEATLGLEVGSVAGIARLLVKSCVNRHV